MVANRELMAVGAVNGSDRPITQVPPSPAEPIAPPPAEPIAPPPAEPIAPSPAEPIAPPRILPSDTRTVIDGLDSVDSTPTPGSDALAGADTEPRELMPPSVSTFEPPTTEMPTPEIGSVSESETVAGQLRELLSSDSPYLEQGRQAGLTAASQRGLQNSTFAAQAGEQARIAAALPIAQQDANTEAQRETLNQNTINQFRQNEMDHIQSMIERAQQGDINAQLQLDQYGFNSALSAQENIERMQQQALAGDIQAQQNYLAFTYSTIMAGIQQGYALDLNDQQFQNAQQILMQEFAQASGLSAQQSEQNIAQLNAAHQNTLDEIGLRSDLATDEAGVALGFQLQAQYLSSVAARQQSASEEIRTIMQTEGLTAAQQNAAVASAQSRMMADIAMLQRFYADSPQWDDDFFRVDGADTNPVGIADPNNTDLLTDGGGGGVTPPGTPPVTPPPLPPPVTPDDYTGGGGIPGPATPPSGPGDLLYPDQDRDYR